MAIGETTESKQSIDNHGFFDIKIQIGKNESLFFYNSAFRLEEFAISQLLKK